MRKTFALVTLALLAACGRPDATHGTEGRGTVVVSIPTDVTDLFPYFSSSNTDRSVSNLVYDHLADIGEGQNTVGDLGFTPVLARDWSWSPDSLTLTFRLNPQARWHDGAPLTARDVAYSANLARNPAFGTGGDVVLANVGAVTAPDAETVVVRFTRRTPEQFYTFVTAVAVVPEHIFGAIAPKDIRQSPLIRQGVGSGRFRLARWEPGTRLELRADSANYRGRPGLDRLILLVSPDFQSAAARFLTNEADVFEHLPPPMLPKVAALPGKRVATTYDGSYTSLAFNLLDPKDTTRPHPVFQDPAVRFALTMATNRAAMLKNVFDTTGVPLSGPFPHTSALGYAGIPQIPYSVQGARETLESHGWHLGADGVRARGGVPLRFRIAVPSSSAPRRQYAVLLQAAFKEVGADVTIDEMDFPAFTASQTAHAFDAELATTVLDPGIESLRSNWTLETRADGNNISSYHSPIVTGLLDSARASFDTAAAHIYTRRALQTIVNDAPGIWLFEPRTFIALDARLQTPALSANGWWTGLADWSVPDARRVARDRMRL